MGSGSCSVVHARSMVTRYGSMLLAGRLSSYLRSQLSWSGCVHPASHEVRHASAYPAQSTLSKRSARHIVALHSDRQMQAAFSQATVHDAAFAQDCEFF